MGQSKEIRGADQAKFLFDKIRIDGQRAVTRVTRIFRAYQDGWLASDFHRSCDHKGPTLSVIRSQSSYLSAGFTSKSWTCVHDTVDDASAVVFQLTEKLQTFKT